MAREVEDTARYGRLIIENGHVTGFAEKGIVGPGMINAGCYVFPRDILSHFQLGLAFSLETDFLAKAVDKHRFDIYVTKGHFIDIGVPEDYARAQIELAGM